MSSALTSAEKAALSKHEKPLRSSCTFGRENEATIHLKAIQKAFGRRLNHYRLLNCKLWYYQMILDQGDSNTAEGGLIGIYRLANKGTRTFLECNGLLAIVCIRKRQFKEAEKFILYVLRNQDDIRTQGRKEQFYRRLVDRIREECILAGLIGRGTSPLSVAVVEQAFLTVSTYSDAQLIDLASDEVSSEAVSLINSLEGFTRNNALPEDLKYLPPPRNEISRVQIGEGALAAMKKIGWKSVCDPESVIFKIWHDRPTQIINSYTIVLASLVRIFNDYKIYIPILVAAVGVTILRYTGEYFCERYKPSSLMIPVGE